MDAEAKKAESMKRFKRRRNICIGVTVVFLAVILLLVILGLTVFKPKEPVSTFNSISIENFNFALDILRFRVNFNATLLSNITVTNPNKVEFKYKNSSSELRYREEVVGEAIIPAGMIKSGGKTYMNVTMVVFADRLVFNPNMFPDATSGNLPLTIHTRISGKAYIFKIFKVHVVASSTCDLKINIRNETLENQICHYKTKL